MMLEEKKKKEEKNFLEMLSDCDCMDHYHHELPSGSVAIIGYTANMWGTSPVNIFFNVKWVMLLVFLINNYSSYHIVIICITAFGIVKTHMDSI